MNGWVRWMKFNAVSGMGILIQLGILAFLTEGLRVPYLVATAVAVEAAILHNFIWHERFTWADRKGRDRLGRLLRFNATTGVFSILGNMFFTKLLVNAGLGHISANIGAIALCSIINFLLNDRVVFVPNIEA
jgi:putative flippase GtrA